MGNALNGYVSKSIHFDPELAFKENNTFMEVLNIAVLSDYCLEYCSSSAKTK